jgi:hypothetical protein
MIKNIEGFCKHLENIGSKAQDIADQCLNYGGCAVYASMIVESCLRSSLPAFGVVATYEGYDLRRQRPVDPCSVDAWNDNGVQFNHVGFMIRCNPKVSVVGDSERVENANNGVKDISGWPLIPGRMNRVELRGIIRYKHDWNSTFDRSLITELQAMIDKELNPAKLHRYR